MWVKCFLVRFCGICKIFEIIVSVVDAEQLSDYVRPKLVETIVRVVISRDLSKVKILSLIEW